MKKSTVLIKDDPGRGKFSLRARHLVLATTVLAPVAAVQAQQQLSDPPPRGIRLDNPGEKKLNRFGVSARVAFNISAEFKNRNPFVFANDPGPGPGAGSGFDHFYDDGYVRPDNTYPNNNGLTYFWGYENASQVMGSDILFHSGSSLSDARTSDSQRNLPFGMELTYNRELGAGDQGVWGLEAAAGFLDLSIRDRDPLTGNIRVITDTYALDAATPGMPITPPNPPYNGSFTGANGPVIGDTPTSRNIGTAPATVTGYRDISADLFTFRLGPYFTFPLSPRTTFQFSAGFASAFIDSTFRFSEDTTTALGGTVTRAGSDSSTDYLIGGFVSGQLSAQLNEHLSAFGGVQFQTLNDFSQRASGKESRLSLGESLIAFAGLGFSF